MNTIQNFIILSLRNFCMPLWLNYIWKDSWNHHCKSDGSSVNSTLHLALIKHKIYQSCAKINHWFLWESMKKTTCSGNCGKNPKIIKHLTCTLWQPILNLFVKRKFMHSTEVHAGNILVSMMHRCNATGKSISRISLCVSGQCGADW